MLDCQRYIVGLVGRNLTPFIQLYNVKRYLNRNGSTHQGDRKEMCFYESFGSVMCKLIRSSDVSQWTANQLTTKGDM